MNESLLPEGYDEKKNKNVDVEHAYQFIGKVGLFCPVKPGIGGGILLRETSNNKTGEKGYAATTGSKGYRWMEANMVEELGIQDGIDRSYYDNMVDAAVKSISEYGDFEWFISDDPYVGPKIINGSPLYFDEPPVY
jgi:hypothetical protein